MNYYIGEQSNILTGVFKGYKNGHYFFELGDRVIVNFQEVDKKIIKTFKLKSNKYRNIFFMVSYEQVFKKSETKSSIFFKLNELKKI